jgi:hypothetical protein
MPFGSAGFLFFFLPVCLFAYFLAPARLRNALLLSALNPPRRPIFFQSVIFVTFLVHEYLL